MPGVIENNIGEVGISAPPKDTKLSLYRQEVPEYNDLSDDQVMEAEWKSNYSDVPYEQFQEAFIKRYTPPSGAIEIFSNNAQSALNSMTSGLIGMQERITGEDLSGEQEYFKQSEEKLLGNEPEEINRPITENLGLILNHKWWAKQLGGLAPWIPLTAGGGAIGAMAGAGLATATSAGTTATRLLQIAGGAFAPGISMSLVDAGNVRQQVLTETGDIDAANQAADENFAMNVPVNLIGSAIQVGTLLKAMKGGGIPITKSLIEKAIGESAYGVTKSAVSMSTMLGMQTIAANISMDHPWNEGLADAAVTGGILGAGMGGSFIAMGKLGQHAKGAIDKKAAKLGIPDESGKLVKPVESLEGEIQPTPEELKVAEDQLAQRKESIKNINPETIEEQITSIKEQLTTNADGTRDRSTTARLGLIEGKLEEMGKSRADVLTELSELYDNSIVEMEHQREIVIIANKHKPNGASETLDALANKPTENLKVEEPDLTIHKFSMQDLVDQRKNVLPVEDANTIAIRERITEGKSAKDIAELYGVPIEDVYKQASKDAGLDYLNIQKVNGKDKLILANDPVSGNTVAIDVNDMSGFIDKAEKSRIAHAEGEVTKQARIKAKIEGARALETIKEVLPEDQNAHLNVIFKAMAEVERMTPEEVIARMVTDVKVDKPAEGIIQKQVSERKTTGGETEYKWENNYHPDNPDFQQRVFWTAYQKPDGRYMVGYSLEPGGRSKTYWVEHGTGDVKSKLGKFGLSEGLKQGEEYVKGATQLRANGEAILHLFTGKLEGTKASDATTVLHEMAHLGLRFLSPEQRSIIEKYFGGETSTWESKTHETYADMFEKYMSSGVAPNKELQPVFTRLKEFFLKVYKGLTDSKLNITLPEEIKNVFDSMLDVKKNEKLKDDYRQSHSEFLSEHGERMVDGKNKIVGFFDNVKPEDRDYFHNKFREYGYKSEDMLNGDIAYYLSKDDKVDVALGRRYKESQGTITPQEVEMLARARGESYEVSRMKREAWIRNISKYEPPKESVGRPIKTSDITDTFEVPDQVKETFNFANQDFSVRESSGESLRGPKSERVDISKSDNFLIKEAERVRVGDKDNPPNPELADAITRIAKDQIDNPVDYIVPEQGFSPEHVNVIGEHFNRINQYTNAAVEIANATSLEARTRLRELHQEHMDWMKSEEGQRVMDIVRLDPDSQGTYPFEPMTEKRRASIYDDLGISAVEGDKLPEAILEQMLNNKNPILFQKTEGLPGDELQLKAIEVGKLIVDKKSGIDFKSYAKELGMTPEQIGRTFNKVYGFIGTRQMFARSDPFGVGRVYDLLTHTREIIDGKADAYKSDPRYIAYERKSEAHQERVESISILGTTYGVSDYKSINGKLSEPWKSKDWIHDSESKQMVKDGLITQEEADAIKQRNNTARDNYTARQKTSTVGKVFSENEVKKMGYTQEEYNDYKMFRDHVEHGWTDERGTHESMLALKRKTAIFNGATPAEADAMYNLPGYHSLGRGDGKWSFFYKDPTSTKGYTYTRFETARDAENARRSMIEKGIVDASDPTSEVHEFQDAITKYGDRFDDHDLAQLIEATGDFNAIEERMKSSVLSEQEKQNLSVEKEFANALMTEYKKRSFSTAHTINRGNVPMIIDAKSRLTEYNRIIASTTSGYGNSETKMQVSGLAAEMAREVPGESYSQSANRRQMAKYVNQFIDEATAVRDPLESKFFDKLRDIGFLGGLAFNTSNMIVNGVVQPLTCDLPEAHKWNRNVFGNGAKFLRAQSEAMRIAFGGKLSESFVRDYPDAPAALAQWHREGKIRASYIDAQVAPGSMPKMLGGESLRKAATAPQRVSESKNRIGSSLLGHMLGDDVIASAKSNRARADELANIAYISDKALEVIGLKKPAGERADFTENMVRQLSNSMYDGTISKSEANRVKVKFGGHFSDNVNFDYGKYNMPKFISSAGWMAQPLKAGFLFKGFTDSYIGFLVNHFAYLDPTKSAMQNLMSNPGHKLVTIAPLLALAGMTGLPFANDIKTALKSAGITDVDRDLRELIGNNTYSDLVIKGLPGLLPKDVAPDLSRRMGVGDVLPQGLPQLDLAQGIGSLFLGAPASFIENFSIESVKDFASGNYTSAYQMMSPVFAKNIIKAITYQDKGLVTRKGKMLLSPDEISAGESVMQGIGFSSMHITGAREFEESMKYATEARKGMVSGFNEKMARAIASGDQSEVQDVIDNITHHNAGVSSPDQYYNYKKNLPAIKARYAEMTQESGMRRTPKSMRQTYQRTKSLYTGE
jgi:hypothetical protein